MAVFDGVIPAIVGAANAAAGDDHEISRSLRFNSGDSAYLDRTPSSATNRRTYTFSCWVKRSDLTLENNIFHANSSSWFRFESSQKIYFWYDGSNSVYTDGIFRDPSAWYHLVLAVDTTQATASDRVKIYVNGVQQTLSGTQPTQNFDTGFNNNIAHFIGSQGASGSNALNGYLAETHFVDGTQLAESDFGQYDSNSVWQPKAYSGSYGTNGFYLKFADNSSNAALGTDSSGNGNTWTVNNITASGFDYVQSTTGSLYAGSWDQAFNGSTSTPAPYIYNTTASVSWGINISGTFEIYTSLPGTYQSSPTTYTLSNGATYEKSTTAAEWINLGSQTNVTSLSVNAPDPGAYVFAIRVDGTILVSTEPKDTDSLIDSPTDYTADSGNNGGNYCTLLPLKNAQTLSNGNLDVVGGSSWQRSVGTLGMYSGKYYWEYTITASNEHIIGVGPPDMQLSGNLGAGDPAGSGYGTETGYVNGTGANGSWSNTGGSTDGDLIGIAFDADNGNMYVYKNGSALNGGIASHTGLVMPQVPVVSLNGSSRSGVINFGQRPFAYTPPTGYVSLCSTNLADSTIADGGTAMNVALYTGNGASNSITGLGFAPDILWLKSRSNGTFPALANSVVGPNYFLRTNGTNTESGPGYNDDIVSFDSDGFTLGADTYYAFCNTNTYTYVGWAWDSGTSTVTNTDGSISAQVRANQSNGCSVITWTASTESAATIGHGLGKQPEFIIAKSRTVDDNFYVFHPALDTGGTISQTLYLNTTDGKTNITGVWGHWTEMNSSTFGIYDTSGNYTNNGNMCAFCYTSVEGFSSFGSYEGNGSADGPFVYTGFKVAWLMIKNANTNGETWTIHDSTRDVDNPAEHRLEPNSGSAESTGTSARYKDLLSNGFKIRGTSGEQNTNGDTYIYAAFAEHPFKSARAR